MLKFYKHRNKCSLCMISCFRLHFAAGGRHWKRHGWGHIKSTQPHSHDPALSTHSEIRRTTLVTDTLHHHPFLFRWFASCRRAPWAKWLWRQLRTKQEIAGWEAEAFTDPLKICTRKPSSGVICKEYSRRWESISSIIPDIYASCF